jgi:hypothetical protein
MKLDHTGAPHIMQGIALGNAFALTVCPRRTRRLEHHRGMQTGQTLAAGAARADGDAVRGLSSSTNIWRPLGGPSIE